MSFKAGDKVRVLRDLRRILWYKSDSDGTHLSPSELRHLFRKEKRPEGNFSPEWGIHAHAGEEGVIRELFKGGGKHETLWHAKVDVPRDGGSACITVRLSSIEKIIGP